MFPWDYGPVAESYEDAIGLFVRQAERLRSIAGSLPCACGMFYSRNNRDGHPVLTKGQSFGMGRCQRCYTLQDFDDRLEELRAYEREVRAMRSTT